MDLEPSTLRPLTDMESPPLTECQAASEDLSDMEYGTLPSLAAIKDSLALAERLAQASLMTSPAARRRLQARHVELGLGDDPGGYVPPKHLLLYLVRSVNPATPLCSYTLLQYVIVIVYSFYSTEEPSVRF